MKNMNEHFLVVARVHQRSSCVHEIPTEEFSGDGMLVLDQNFNQSVDNGGELLSNPLSGDIGCTNARMQPMNTGYTLILSDMRHDQERCWRGAALTFNATVSDVSMGAQS